LPFSENAKMVKQTNQIFCAENHASRLLLPVVSAH
jgi:hypothetical protein